MSGWHLINMSSICAAGGSLMSYQTCGKRGIIGLIVYFLSSQGVL